MILKIAVLSINFRRRFENDEAWDNIVEMKSFLPPFK